MKKAFDEEKLVQFVKAGKREYQEAFRIQEYLHLEAYDKQVMASLIASAKVMGRTGWKCSGNLGTFRKRF